jgi:hypothetical protein
MASNWCCFHLSTCPQDTNYMQIHHISKSSLSICWQVPYGMPNLPVISELILHWSSSTTFKILHIFICTTCGGMTWFFTVHNCTTCGGMTWFFAVHNCTTCGGMTILHSPQHFHIFWVNHSNICIPITLPLKAVMSISCVSDAVFLRLMQNIMHIHCFFKSTTRKLCGACNMLRNTHPLRNNAEGYGSNSHNDNDITEGSITYHSWLSKWVEKLLGTHSYAWVFRQPNHSQTHPH